MKKEDFKKCPWRWNRVCVTPEECFIMNDYINSICPNGQIGSFLEFGCGYSSWYLSQMNWSNYISVEDWQPSIDTIKKHIPYLKVVTKWEDIPKIKYNFVFCDSHAGGNATKWERNKPFEWANLNDLFLPETIVFAHDHKIIPESAKWTNIHWKKTIEQFGWKLIDQFKTKRNIGVYKKA